MNGIFRRQTTPLIGRVGGKTLSCSSCGLYQNCTSPRMKPYGNFRKRIMNIGEAPGEVEDRTGKPFQGKTGKALQRMYERLGVDLFEDCININAVLCRPTDKQGNRAPQNLEIDCCRKTVINTILQYKPQVIILLGNAAIYSLLKYRWKQDLGGIMKWRGWAIPDQDFKCWICPTFHPSYVERAEQLVVERIWEEDLRQAIACAKQPFPVYKEPEIEIINDLSVLDRITKGEIAFDYETTGKKPHAEGHRIVSCAVADTEDHAYAFLMPQTHRERKPLLNLFTNPAIGKIAQNMKFEEAWSEVRLRTEVINWVWDTMIASHILDNRPGVTGLKFQSYVQFGIVDYSSGVDTYLKDSSAKDANAFNKIDKLLTIPGGKEQLLKYNGLDAVYELRLANKQRSNLLPF